jgi:putative DNA primase/helicase
VSTTTTSSRPTAPIVEWGTIPDEMLHARRWVGWRYEQRPDPQSGELKWTKVPYQAKCPTYKASSTNGKTWGTAKQAEAAYAHGDVDGVGFVLGSGWAGADFDGQCRDAATGVIDEAVLAGVRQLDSYSEVSPSGAGVHTLFHAETVRGTRRNHVELYSAGRYFTVTGQQLPDTPATVEPRGHLLAGFCARYNLWGDKGRDTREERQRQYEPLDLSDEELLDRACHACNGEKFRALWEGSIAPFPSASEAVASLLWLLAYWTRKDAASMDRLFRRSGLMAEKWDEKRGASTWGEQEIESAIEGVSSVYEPAGRERQAQPADERDAEDEHEQHDDGSDPAAAASLAATLAAPAAAQAEIVVNHVQLRRPVEATLAALRAVNRSLDVPVIFVRGGSLVRVHPPDEGGETVIEPLDEHGLTWLATHCANYVKVDKDGIAVDAFPPRAVIQTVLGRGRWPGIPTLRGTVAVPTLRPYGTILDKPGYDKATELIYVPAPGFVMPIPDAPTALEVAAAVDTIDGEVLIDFPFADAASRANAWALLLTPILRPAIEEGVPLALLDAPSPGSGKTLLQRRGGRGDGQGGWHPDGAPA